MALSEPTSGGRRDRPIASPDDARRKLRPRGPESRGPAPYAARGGGVAAALRNGALGLAALALVGGSFASALWPDGFEAAAPITLARDMVTEGTAVAAAPAPAPAAAPHATDDRPLGSLGAPRGTVGDAEPTGGAKVIDVPKEVRRPSGPIIVRDPSDMRQPRQVAHVPDRTLIDDSEHGPLPVRAGRRRPLDVYAGHWSGRRGKRIALVIGGIGVSQSTTQAAIDALPGKVTIGFSADGNSLKRWMQQARRDGHEILLQVPMQAFGQGGADSRGRRLQLDLDDRENGERLRRSLGRLTNYVGVMNYRGGAFQANADALSPVMREVRDRGLLYLDDGSSAQSQAVRLAGEEGVPFANADIQIDVKRDAESIASQLDRLEEMARGTGRAIGVATAYPETIAAIARWIGSVEARGFEIVPVSALANDPARR